MRIQTDVDTRLYLLAAKSKVVSIPRLELLGCLLLVKLLKEVNFSIVGCVEINDLIGWTDSEVAICWIKGKSRCWKSWVENKDVAIRAIRPAISWYHVPSGYNPADIPTEFLCQENLQLGRLDVKRRDDIKDVVA